jgi:hypothetical protein
LLACAGVLERMRAYLTQDGMQRRLTSYSGGRIDRSHLLSTEFEDENTRQVKITLFGVYEKIENIYAEYASLKAQENKDKMQKESH